MVYFHVNVLYTSIQDSEEVITLSLITINGDHHVYSMNMIVHISCENVAYVLDLDNLDSDNCTF